MYRRYDNNVYGSWTIDYAMNLGYAAYVSDGIRWMKV